MYHAGFVDNELVFKNSVRTSRNPIRTQQNEIVDYSVLRQYMYM